MRITRSHHSGRSVLTALVVVLLAGACTDGDETTSESAPAPSASATGPLILWPAPSDPLARAVEAGLEPERREVLTYHVHAHLDVFVDGTPVYIPPGLGINIADPDVKTFGGGTDVGYGGISECAEPCISPLHTHDPDGILHTEAAGDKPNTLGQFFTEWGIELTSGCLADRCGGVALYIDGQEFTGDPNTIELLDQREIAIVIGTPPAEIPSRADFSRA